VERARTDQVKHAVVADDLLRCRQSGRRGLGAWDWGPGYRSFDLVGICSLTRLGDCGKLDGVVRARAGDLRSGRVRGRETRAQQGRGRETRAQQGGDPRTTRAECGVPLPCPVLLGPMHSTLLSDSTFVCESIRTSWRYVR